MLCRHRHSYWRLLLVVTALSVAGCGSKTHVSGKVTLNGQPVTSGNITWFSTKGPPVTATIANGRYEIDNVLEGNCIVTVVQMPQGGLSPDEHGDMKKLTTNTKSAALSKTSTNGLPSRYADTTTSPLTFTVKKGKNEIDLALEP